jgi:hypothetical protein
MWVNALVSPFKDSWLEFVALHLGKYKFFHSVAKAFSITAYHHGLYISL